MMLSKDTTDAINAVDELNVEYYEQTGDETRLPFDFVYATYWQGIKFFDEIVWDDDGYQVNSTDITDDNDNVIGETREAIVDCVRRRVKEIQEITGKFKL